MSDLTFTTQNQFLHHGIQGQKWGVRNGPPYPLDRKAKSIYEKAKQKEPKITNDLQNIANNTDSRLYGLENRLKTKESIYRKQSQKEINDAVRYTFIFDNNNFVDKYFKVKNELKKKGYEEIKCKNYFQLYRENKVKHKAVQSNFKDSDGYVFEIQFQTKQSQNAKNKKIPIYEERRQVGISKDRASYLEREMVRLAEEVPYPKNIELIKTY